MRGESVVVVVMESSALEHYVSEIISYQCRGRTYAKKLRFLRKKRAGYANLKMPYAKNSDLTHQNAFSLFVFCTQQRRFVEHLP